MLGNNNPMALQLQTNLFMLMVILVLNIGLRFIDAIWLKGGLNQQYAIIPRQQFSFARIFLSPFLHKDRIHLFGNMMPLMLLSGIAMFPDIQIFWLATVIIMFTDGLGTWLFGNPARHLGASGLVLGYFSFLLTRGLFELELFLIFTTLFIAGMCRKLFGLVVWRAEGVSTVGHYFGFLGGILAAWFTAWLKANYPI